MIKTGRKFIKKHSAPRRKKGQELVAVLLVRTWQREIIKVFKDLERNFKKVWRV